MRKQNRGTLIIIGVAIIAIIFLGGGILFFQKSPTKPVNTNPSVVVKPTLPLVPTESMMIKDNSSAKTGATNEDLDKDLKNIGGKIGSMNNDSVKVDTSFQNQSQDNQ